MTQMLERIQAAIERTYDVDQAGDITNLRDVARAALEAMRRADSEMLEAGLYQARRNMPLLDQWQAMIRKALGEG